LFSPPVAVEANLIDENICRIKKEGLQAMCNTCNPLIFLVELRGLEPLTF